MSLHYMQYFSSFLLKPQGFDCSAQFFRRNSSSFVIIEYIKALFQPGYIFCWQSFSCIYCWVENRWKILLQRRNLYKSEFTERNGDLEDMNQLPNLIMIQLIHQDIIHKTMNVLKKIKSKNKDLEPSQPTTQAKQQCSKEPNINYGYDSSESMISKAKSQDRQKRPMSLSSKLSCEKSIYEIDQDQLTLNEYMSKKQKRQQDIQRISLFKLIGDEELNEYPFCLYVKKSYYIGNICLFEGQVAFRKDGKEQRKRKMQVSCSLEAIQFPQNIEKIYLNKLTFLNDSQGIFCFENILKFKDRGYKKY